MSKEEKRMVKSTSKETMLNKMVSRIETLDHGVHLGKFIIDSGFAPDHFNKQKNPPAAVVMALQVGQEIGLSPAQSLHEIVPINGLMSVKGDAAKALIMQSGLCESWEEKEEGDYDQGTFKVTITSRRKDTGEVITRSFSVADAKRAGLYVSQDAVKKNPKLSYGPWFKYPTRMIRYRCLGFIARDLYSDVMKGTKTKEEVEDYVDIDHVEVTNSKSSRVVEEAMEATSKKVEAEEAEVVEEASEEEGQQEPAEEPVDTSGPEDDTPEEDTSKEDQESESVEEEEPKEEEKKEEEPEEEKSSSEEDEAEDPDVEPEQEEKEAPANPEPEHKEEPAKGKASVLDDGLMNALGVMGDKFDEEGKRKFGPDMFSVVKEMTSRGLNDKKIEATLAKLESEYTSKEDMLKRATVDEIANIIKES